MRLDLEAPLGSVASEFILSSESALAAFIFSFASK